MPQMDAGADLVITQLFYDVERFFQFEKDCRSVGIKAPIIPGAPGGARRCPILDDTWLRACH